MPIPRDGTVAWIPMPGEAVTTRDHTPSLGRIPTQTRRESPLWGDIIKVISSLLFPFFFFFNFGQDSLLACYQQSNCILYRARAVCVFLKINFFC